MDAFAIDVIFLIFSTNLLAASLEITELSDVNRSAKESLCSLNAKNGVCFVAAFVWLLYATSSSG